MLQDPKAYADYLFDHYGQQAVPLSHIFEAAKQYRPVPAEFWAAVAARLNETGALNVAA